MVTMIAIAVLMVLVVGAIRFTGTNREAAVVKIKSDRMVACADTARRYLLSRLKLYGVAVTDLKLDAAAGTTYTKLLDEPVAADRTMLGPAHYGQNLTSAPASIGVVSAATMGASRRQARDLANALPGSSSLGGQYYRVVMKCQEAGTEARESEVEFVFRYGM